jgi:hypothetical protein
MVDIAQRAHALLLQLHEVTHDATANNADDILLFFYDLVDHYVPRTSSGAVTATRSFNFLRDIIYRLESRPDDTMREDDSLKFMEQILQDLASGRTRVLRT